MKKARGSISDDVFFLFQFHLFLSFVLSQFIIMRRIDNFSLVLNVLSNQKEQDRRKKGRAPFLMDVSRLSS